MTTGAAIRQARHIAGLTLEDLAARAGTSAPTLSQYEHGRKEPRLATFERILAAAGFDLFLDVRPRGFAPPMNRADRRSLALHRAVAARLATAPETVLTQARNNLEHLRVVHTDGSAATYLERWADLLDGPLDEIVEVLTSPTSRARELRHVSPFAGVLSEDDRRAILAASGT